MFFLVIIFLLTEIDKLTEGGSGNPLKDYFPLIGVVVTVGLFYLKIRDDKQKEGQKRNLFQREKMKYFQALLNSIDNKLEHQIGYYKNYFELIKSTPYDLPDLSLVPLNDLERISQKASIEDYYHAYLTQVNKDGHEEFRKIISVLDYFYADTKKLEFLGERNAQIEKESKSKYKSLLEKAMDETTALLVNENVMRESELWELVNSRMLKFHSLKDSSQGVDIRFFQDNFVAPLRSEIFQYGRKMPEVLSLVFLLKNITWLYSEIVNQNQDFARSFQKKYHYMTTVLGHYKEATETIRKYVL